MLSSLVGYGFAMVAGPATGGMGDSVVDQERKSDTSEVRVNAAPLAEFIVNRNDTPAETGAGGGFGSLLTVR